MWEYSNELYHYRTKGSKNGVRRYQYPDGSLTPEGRIHYGVGQARNKASSSESDKGLFGRIKSELDRRKEAKRKDKYKKMREENKKLKEQLKDKSDKDNKQSDADNKQPDKPKEETTSEIRAKTEHIKALNDYHDALAAYNKRAHPEKWISKFMKEYVAPRVADKAMDVMQNEGRRIINELWDEKVASKFDSRKTKNEYDRLKMEYDISRLRNAPKYEKVVMEYNIAQLQNATKEETARMKEYGKMTNEEILKKYGNRKPNVISNKP